MAPLMTRLKMRFDVYGIADRVDLVVCFVGSPKLKTRRRKRVVDSGKVWCFRSLGPNIHRNLRVQAENEREGIDSSEMRFRTISEGYEIGMKSGKASVGDEVKR
jgi:hypothetical protein